MGTHHKLHAFGSSAELRARLRGDTLHGDTWQQAILAQ